MERRQGGPLRLQGILKKMVDMGIPIPNFQVSHQSKNERVSNPLGSTVVGGQGIGRFPPTCPNKIQSWRSGGCTQCMAKKGTEIHVFLPCTKFKAGAAGCPLLQNQGIFSNTRSTYVVFLQVVPSQLRISMSSVAQYSMQGQAHSKSLGLH